MASLASASALKGGRTRAHPIHNRNYPIWTQNRYYYHSWCIWTRHRSRDHDCYNRGKSRRGPLLPAYRACTCGLSVVSDGNVLTTACALARARRSGPVLTRIQCARRNYSSRICSFRVGRHDLWFSARRGTRLAGLCSSQATATDGTAQGYSSVGHPLGTLACTISLFYRLGTELSARGDSARFFAVHPYCHKL